MQVCVVAGPIQPVPPTASLPWESGGEGPGSLTAEAADLSRIGRRYGDIHVMVPVVAHPQPEVRLQRDKDPADPHRQPLAHEDG